MRIRKLAVVATLISVLALTGCGGSSDDAANTSSDSKSSTEAEKPGTSDPGQPGESQEGGDQGDTSRDGTDERTSGEDDSDPAVIAYRKYRTAMDLMAKSGGKTTSQLSAVAKGELLRESTSQAKFYREKKLRNLGNTRILWVQKLDLSKTALTLRACYDISAAKTVDASGKNAMKKGAPTRWLDEMQMQYVDDKSWRAIGGRVRAQDC